jgi:predicted Zn finger-like uncharacterized protein
VPPLFSLEVRMIVTCPSCKNKFRLQESLIKSPYQKMRCSQCNHVFVYEKKEGRVEQRPLLSGILEERETKKRSGLRRIGLIAAVIAVILAAYGYYYWTNYPGASDRWLKVQKTEGYETALRDGKAFLVKGMIYNGSTKPRAFVMLKARIFDDKGVVMGERAALAGLKMSQTDFEQMRRSDVEAKINEFRKSGGNAFILPSHNEVPFTIVFPDSYSLKPKQYSVEILEAPKQ